MDPRKLKVNELKEQLQLAGLSANGKKEDLIARLLEHQKAEEEALNAGVPPTGTGESFDWDDSKFDVDDLAPPSDPVAPATTTPAKTTAPAEKSTVDKPTSSSSSKGPATAGATKPSAAAATTTSVTTLSTAGETTNTSTAESVQFQGSVNKTEVLKVEFEKRKNRAARFGIPLKEQDKAIERAARFGVPVNASVTVPLANTSGASTSTTPLKSLPTKPTTQIPADVLDKRRERFGIQAPETSSSGSNAKKSSLDAAEEEKKRKRAAKFGSTPTTEDSNKKLKK
ncbi:hypothetical protein BGZ65_006734 [Modicella reniformis]|uniref:SAP domain-containing protein n=1 Tax=Modicella reniformis TaxID=1440133 RepID=A0A9P6IK44_9FUNG|nr:hypothetical protein BGZ65_006734 [Modicella reniformis]